MRLPDGEKAVFLRLGMLFVGGGDGALDLLALEQLVLAERDLVVLADEQREAGIGETILHHPHDDKPRRDKVGKGCAQGHAAAMPHRNGKNHKIE